MLCNVWFLVPLIHQVVRWSGGGYESEIANCAVVQTRDYTNWNKGGGVLYDVM
jgi:hypothetical protein